MTDSFEQIASELARVAQNLHVRGWMLGTSGNLSAVADREPLRLAITPVELIKVNLPRNKSC